MTTRRRRPAERKAHPERADNPASAPIFPSPAPESPRTSAPPPTGGPRPQGSCESDERYRLLVHAMGEGVALHEIICDDSGRPRDYRFLEVNPAFEDLTGLAASDIIGRTVLEVMPTTELAWIERYGRVALGGEPVHFEESAGALGRRYEVRAYAAGNGRFVTTFTDITARQHAEEALRLTQLSVDCAADLIHWIAPDGRLLYVSDSVCRRHGCARERMLQRSIFDLDPTMSPERWARHWQELMEQGSVTLETTHRTESGEEFPVEVTANFVEQNGEEYNFAFARDTSERRRVEKALLLAKEQTEAANRELASEAAALEEANATITRIAATDDLTGLANRRCFYDFLGKAVSLARRHGSPLALLSFDLDGLKRVNDSAGHEAGDEVLASFAALFPVLCRLEDLPARLGGDEFSVLLPGIDLGGARGLAKRVLAAVRSCEVLAQRGVTVSGGAAQWTPGELPDDLLRRADEALYAAKRGGGDAVAGSG